MRLRFVRVEVQVASRWLVFHKALHVLASTATTEYPNVDCHVTFVEFGFYLSMSGCRLMQ